MRLFVAIEIDPAVAAAVADAGRELRRRVGTQAPRARVTWVPLEQLHVTVRFVGEVDETKAGVIATALAPDVDVEPFPISIERMGMFPERGAPRVFWVGLTAGVESLASVEREVSARLASCGIPGEDRPYRPHVTLGRVKHPTGLRPARLFSGLNDRRFGTSPVDAITLFQSRPTAQGHVHVPLQRTPVRRVRPL